MASFLFKNGNVFDGTSADLERLDVLVDGDRIVEVGERLRSETATSIDLAGKVLMPGLIDAHIHAYSYHVDLQAGDRYPSTFVAHDARRMLEEALNRGFTSVRDTGGADYGLRMAIEHGLVRGPRLFYCGKALSQTGGHGDFRHPYEHDLCTCGGYEGHLSVVVDGVDEIRRAIRDELHRGAHFIKIFASGGVSSTGDRLSSIQFSADEVRAAVDEVERHGTYVTAHIHPDEALRRAVELGVHCIEHGTFISDETAALAAERGTSIVPTLAVIKALAKHGREKGFPKESLEKLAIAEPQALGSLEIMQRAGIEIGFGTDLIGDLDRHQCTEFVIRREVFESIDILRSATSVNARIIGQGDHLGRITPGYLADLIVVDGDPLADISLFDEFGGKVSVVMKGGTLVKSRSYPE
jgi:imidazolonepropionase-like amidohydrolase